MKNKLHYSRLALVDLEEIQNYVLADSCSLDITEKEIGNILDIVKKLETFPEIGMVLDELVPFKSDYRVLSVKKYLIFYRVDESDIYVDRILHSRRNYIRILFGR